MQIHPANFTTPLQNVATNSHGHGTLLYHRRNAGQGNREDQGLKIEGLALGRVLDQLQSLEGPHQVQ
jgi:hypothetical protein